MCAMFFGATYLCLIKTISPIIIPQTQVSPLHHWVYTPDSFLSLLQRIYIPLVYIKYFISYIYSMPFVFEFQGLEWFVDTNTRSCREADGSRAGDLGAPRGAHLQQDREQQRQRGH